MVNATAYADFLAENKIDVAMLPRFPIPLDTMPHGWLQPIEISLLYLAGLSIEGPFLEIGAWIGRSTIALAQGLKDRAGRDPPKFDTVDFGVVSIADWRQRLHTDPLKMKDIDSVLANIFIPGGSIAALVQNLQAHSVLEFVSNIVRGDFSDLPLKRQYGFVFCDTLHNSREIELYCPVIRDILVEGGWLICDDIIDRETGDRVKEIVGLNSYFLTHPEHRYTKFLIGRRQKTTD